MTTRPEPSSDVRAVLDTGARKVLGRALTNTEGDQFHKYVELLRKWQKTQRLIGSDDPRWIIESLLLDSLLFVPLIPRAAGTLLDLGSGAGLPGIPIKIVRPELRVTLAESRQRRVSFLRTVVREIGLQEIDVTSERIGRDGARGDFDAIVARCAGRLGDVLQLAVSLLAPGGLVIAAGPPNPYDLPIGEWVQVGALNPESPRWFAIYRSVGRGTPGQ